MGISGAGVDTDALSALIEEAKNSGGSEIANTQPFIERWCRAMGLEPPALSSEQNHRNDYVFERRISFKHPDGSTSPGRIDLYKRGSFVLESKQSSLAQARVAHPDQLNFLPEDRTQVKLGTARRGTGGWDRAMLAARNQAESYARALPVEHGYPPFLIVLDVGHVMEVYADFSGQGKNYAHFPDRQSYRLMMDDLLRPDVQERLSAIWTDPLSLDPAKRSAEVTRDIAGRLSIIARRLETRHDPRDVAEFLMRCLFTMFAEDVELIPKGKFSDLLKSLEDRPEAFPPALESLWKTMDEGGYDPHMMEVLKRFNGSLFKSRRALQLAPEDIHELYVASMQDWSDVEPAIFGTLLERALDPHERSKLGAHYTPRAYVERLVIPTIIEPLRADWEEVQTHVADLKREGKDAEALKVVKAFHHKLCTTRVLDPACGSGNFLYVSLELMKKLEGEVLVALDELGEDQGRLAMEGETVGPRQFYGLEVNKRAVPIADLVLWIGFLKWQLRTVGLKQISEPVLHAYGTIRAGDAVLDWDEEMLERDETGSPITVWDGVTHRRHDVTNKLIPDTRAQKETYSYRNPRPAKWPPADFIVSNPPFIGNKLLRRRLGSGYVEALYRAYAALPASLDFVSYWWAKAAELVSSGQVRRFGFVTTKAIAQVQNRPVIASFLSRPGAAIAFAIPNHPWINSADAAAVRVGFTVGVVSEDEGSLATVANEAKGPKEEPPIVTLAIESGTIHSDLSVGQDVTAVAALRSNDQMSFQGCKLGHEDFILPPPFESRFREAYEGQQVVREYIGGDQIKDGAPSSYVVDLFGQDGADQRFEDLFQYLLDHVRPHKSEVRRDSHRKRWWVFGEPRSEMRTALEDLSVYFVTVEVSRHRYYVVEPWPRVLIDGSAIAIASSSMSLLASLHSRIHSGWCFRLGGRMGVGNDPRYQNSVVFDPFPFPAFPDLPLDLVASLDALGERLDGFRKERLAGHDFLTMTSLYNVLERLRELDNGAEVEPLSEKERDIHEAGLVSVLKEIHDDIDRAVFEAYGWADLIPALVGKPGATTPSPHKSAAQEAAEEELLTRLVALNRERAAEEARGHVRWLRPEYQIPRLGKKVATPEGEQVEADIAVVAKAQRPKWPADALDQIRQVRDVLAKAPAPMPVEGIAMAFDGRLTDKRRERVRQVLTTLVATGAAMTAGASFFVPR